MQDFRRKTNDILENKSIFKNIIFAKNKHLQRKLREEHFFIYQSRNPEAFCLLALLLYQNPIVLHLLHL